MFELFRGHLRNFWSYGMHQLCCGHLPKRDGHDKLYQLRDGDLLDNCGVCMYFLFHRSVLDFGGRYLMRHLDRNDYYRVAKWNCKQFIHLLGY